MTEKKTPEGRSYQEGQIDALILIVAEILAALPPQVAEGIIERTVRNTLTNVDDDPAVLGLIEGYESTWGTLRDLFNEAKAKTGEHGD